LDNSWANLTAGIIAGYAMFAVRLKASRVYDGTDALPDVYPRDWLNS
jgi:hypothetical protein